MERWMERGSRMVRKGGREGGMEGGREEHS